MWFQSTRPVKGATGLDGDDRRRRRVSIHAPREGRDVPRGVRRQRVIRFQSTRPVKGATKPFEASRAPTRFQSTRPVKGATGTCGPSTTWAAFQSTRPVKGATSKLSNDLEALEGFNPRAP